MLCQNVLSSDAAAFAHASEDASRIVEVNRRIQFCNLALVHDTYPFKIQDCLDAMRWPEKLAMVVQRKQARVRTDNKHRLSFETGLHALLDKCIRLKVSACIVCAGV